MPVTSKDDVLFARRFVLHRTNDVTGISGTGDVADGVLWPDGTASVRWRGEHPSVAFWDRGRVSIEFINGHANASTLEFHDPEQPTGLDADHLRRAVELAVSGPRSRRLVDTILTAVGPWLSASTPQYTSALAPDTDETLIRLPANFSEASIELERLQVIARRYRDQAAQPVDVTELNRQLAAVRDLVTDMEGITGARSWAKWLRVALGEAPSGDMPAPGSVGSDSDPDAVGPNTDPFSHAERLRTGRAGGLDPAAMGEAWAAAAQRDLVGGVQPVWRGPIEGYGTGHMLGLLGTLNGTACTETNPCPLHAARPTPDNADRCTATITGAGLVDLFQTIRCTKGAGHYDPSIQPQQGTDTYSSGGWHENGERVWCDLADGATPHVDGPTTAVTEQPTPDDVAVAAELRKIADAIVADAETYPGAGANWHNGINHAIQAMRHRADWIHRTDELTPAAGGLPPAKQCTKHTGADRAIYGCTGPDSQES